MSKIGLIAILILLTGRSYAQQDYFVLIQSDNKQPFHVRLGSRSFSSTTEGALILSQLKDSTYMITVGFPGQLSSEQLFSVSLHHKDQQFLLRNEEEKRWVLYNPLTGEMRSPEPKEEKTANVQGVKKDDAFSRLMAGVVHDTAVMYNTYAAGPPPGSRDTAASAMVAVPTGSGNRDSSTMGVDSAAARVADHPDTSTTAKSPATVLATPVPDSAKIITTAPVAPTGKPASQTDSSTVATTVPGATMIPAVSPVTNTTRSDSAAMTPAGSSPAVVKGTVSQAAVLKLSERKLPHSIRLAFSDRTPGRKTDTVIMYIMKDTPALAGPRTPVTAATPALHSSPDTGRRLIPRASVAGPDTTTRVASGTPPSTKSSLPFVNSDCHALATDYDVDKLRVKMLESVKDEDRITAARKVFKTKCFSTRQIRALSEVFTTDALKFRFFETAYPFASDDRFRELASTLADPVYNSKFKAMTGQ